MINPVRLTVYTILSIVLDFAPKPCLLAQLLKREMRRASSHRQKNTQAHPKCPKCQNWVGEIWWSWKSISEYLGMPLFPVVSWVQKNSAPLVTQKTQRLAYGQDSRSPACSGLAALQGSYISLDLAIPMASLRLIPIGPSSGCGSHVEHRSLVHSKLSQVQFSLPMSKTRQIIPTLSSSRFTPKNWSNCRSQYPMFIKHSD